MIEISASLPRNFLRPCLLLLLSERTGHGYDLMEQLPQLGIPYADPGGLYRTLRAMEQENLVTSWWEPSSSGPARRTYAMTEEGEDWLHAWAGSLHEVGRILETFGTRYAASAGRGVHT